MNGKSSSVDNYLFIYSRVGSKLRTVFYTLHFSVIELTRFCVCEDFKFHNCEACTEDYQIVIF